jgi:1-phosphofructokinase
MPDVVMPDVVMPNVVMPNVVMPNVMVFGPNPFVSVALESMMGNVEGDEIHFHAAGQGVWVARAVAGLGGDATLVTTRGGEHGTMLAALLAEEPFAATFVGVAGEGACYVDDRRRGDRTRLAERPADPLSRHEVDDLYGATLAAGISADIAVLCGTGADERLPGDFYSRLAHDLRVSGTPVVADLSGSLAEAALSGGLEVLKMSESEVRALEDDEREGDSVDLRVEAERLVQRGARRVIVTRGGEPAIAVDESGVRELHVPQLATADHRGAGDSMTAAIAIGLAAGDPWEDVLTRAAATGAANVTRRGLGTSSDAEISAIEALASTSPPEETTRTPR